MEKKNIFLGGVGVDFNINDEIKLREKTSERISEIEELKRKRIRKFT